LIQPRGGRDPRSCWDCSARERRHLVRLGQCPAVDDRVDEV